MTSFIKTLNVRPVHGVGIGLRSQHFSYILQHLPPVPWFEALSDNYINEGGIARYRLQQIRQHYPLVLHGVGLSLGSSDPLDQNYLIKLKKLATELQASYISEHLSWISIDKHYAHQLLPLPYTEEALHHIVNRIIQAQDFLGQRILIENVSSYLTYQHSTLSEWDFLNAVAAQADCYILLDINNIYVSAKNHGFNPLDYLNNINTARVKQFHLAGHEDHGDYLLDTHNAHISTPVWELYASALQHYGAVPTLIEWDAKLPEFPVLQQEAEMAQKFYKEVTIHHQRTPICGQDNLNQALNN